MGQSLEDQYKLLIEIKGLKEKAASVKRKLEKIPGEIEEIQNTLDGRKIQFEEAKSVLDAHSKRQREAEQDLKAREDGIVKAQDKLMEVKTNDAYAAAQTEIDAQKREKGKLEEEILGLMTKLETETTVFKEAESNFKNYEAQYKKEKAELDKLKAEFEAEIKSLDENVSAIVSKMEPEVATLYKRIARDKEIPVVDATGAMCSGCRIKLRPQLFNQVIGFVTVHPCPQCSRILVLEPQAESKPD